MINLKKIILPASILASTVGGTITATKIAMEPEMHKTEVVSNPIQEHALEGSLVALGTLGLGTSGIMGIKKKKEQNVADEQSDASILTDNTLEQSEVSTTTDEEEVPTELSVQNLTDGSKLITYSDGSIITKNICGEEVGGVNKQGETFVTEKLNPNWTVRRESDGENLYYQNGEFQYSHYYSNKYHNDQYTYNIDKGVVERYDGVKVIVTGTTNKDAAKYIELHPNGTRVEIYNTKPENNELESLTVTPNGFRVELRGGYPKNFVVYNKQNKRIAWMDKNSVGGFCQLYPDGTSSYWKIKYFDNVWHTIGVIIQEWDNDSVSGNGGASTSTNSSQESSGGDNNSPLSALFDAYAAMVSSPSKEPIKPACVSNNKKNTEIKLSFADVGGQDAAIDKIKKTILYPIKYPDLYKNKKISHGIVMYGPPGTGKSLLAEAIASETGANFIKLNGLEMESSLVGKSESNWRQLFEKARKQQPCIIFLDEVEAVGAKEDAIATMTIAIKL